MKKFKKNIYNIQIFASFILFIISIIMACKITMCLSFILLICCIFRYKYYFNYIFIIILCLNSSNYVDTYIFSLLYYGFIILLFNLNNMCYTLLNPFLNLNRSVRIDGKKKLKNVNNVKVNDIIVLNKDENILVDGEVLNGESVLVNIQNGKNYKVSVHDKVYSGSLNKEKELKIKVTKEYKNTELYKKEKYINNILKSTTTFEKIINISIILLSFVILFIYLFFYFNNINNIYFLLVILLLLIFKYIIRNIINFDILYLFNNEIYFKNKNLFFNMNKVKNIFYDKSGVITTGNYRVTKEVVFNKEQKDLFEKYLFLGENLINNKISNAIINYKKMEVDTKKIKEYKYIDSRGITYKYNKDYIVIGNRLLLKENNIICNDVDDIGTIIYLAINDKLIGYIVISDSIKKSISKNITKLSKNGIKKNILLSGDNSKIVNIISHEANISDFYSNSNLYEKAFWYLYISKKNKGKNIYIRNDEYDFNHLNADYNLTFSKNLDFINSDIIIKEDIYNVVRIFKCLKNFIYDFVKYLLIFIIFVLLNILIIYFRINYFCLLFAIDIILYLYMYYNIIKK